MTDIAALMRQNLLEVFGPEGAPPVVRGMDIGLVRDDRIATLYTFLLDG